MEQQLTSLMADMGAEYFEQLVVLIQEASEIMESNKGVVYNG